MVLDDGEVLEADLVVIGAGIIPATQYVKDLEKALPASQFPFWSPS